MGQSNLAAAILGCAGSTVAWEPKQSCNLTNEEAIRLADWLHGDSLMDEWRDIYLMPAPSELEPANTESRVSVRI